MPKRDIIASALYAGALAAIFVLDANYVVRAEDCLAEPNQQPAEGQHWYYRSDRATNQKCWYLKETGITTPQATAPEASPTAGADVARSGQPGATPLRKAEREALFEEFLRWQQRQRNR